MSMTRQWKLVAALGLGLSLPSQSIPVQPTRVVAQRDPSFSVPDSVRALLSMVTSLVVDPDSSIYLADYQLGAILHLDASGSFRRVIGRRGNGPGEFSSILAMGLHRDSLWAMDPALVRLTLMPLKGAGVQTVPLGQTAITITSPGAAQSRRGLPATILPDGSLLMEEPLVDVRHPEDGPSAVLLLRTQRNLQVTDTVAQLTMRHSTMVFSLRDREVHYGQPFGDDPRYAVAPDGSQFVTVTRDAATREGDNVFVVTGWRNDRQVYRRELTYQPRRLSGTVVDSVVNRLAGPQRKDQPATGMAPDSIRAHLFRPAYLSPVREVKMSRDGAVWLRVDFADSPKGVADWLVLSRNGFELGRVTLPENFRILEANRRSVLGLEFDDMDVPLVSRYVLPEWGGQ